MQFTAQFSGKYYKNIKGTTDRTKAASALVTVSRNISSIWKINERQNVYEGGLVWYLKKYIDLIDIHEDGYSR
jgi:hypothetical protein